MAYDRFFFTGVKRSPRGQYLAYHDGEYLGTYSTWTAANAAAQERARR